MRREEECNDGRSIYLPGTRLRLPVSPMSPVSRCEAQDSPWPVHSLPAKGEGATSVLDSALTRGQSSIGRRTSIVPRISAACCQVTHSNRWASLVFRGRESLNCLSGCIAPKCFVLIAMRRNVIGPSRSLPANVTPSDVYQTPTTTTTTTNLLLLLFFFFSQPCQPSPSSPSSQSNDRGCASCHAASPLHATLHSPLRPPVRSLSRRPANASRPSGRAASSHSARGSVLAIRSAEACHGILLIVARHRQWVRQLARQLCLRTAVSAPVSPLFTIISTASPAIWPASNFSSAHKRIISCGRVFARRPCHRAAFFGPSLTRNLLLSLAAPNTQHHHPFCPKPPKPKPMDGAIY